ncbi:MAG: hypothetical protein LAT64_07880 [Phycisphaerales bacterium]|nr:hypothetical protein [Planctomycetota bacterium]MCH8508674.1 hypothetical protein [Phycisphaerales bacterium]
MRLVLLLMIVLLGRPALGAEDPLASGFALLDEAVRLRVSDPERSARLAGDAAVLIDSSLADGGLDNPAAQRALGNAWLLSGELGRAVLAYRRAEAAAPSDPLVRSSLQHARTMVAADVGWQAGPLGPLEGWRGSVPRAWVFALGLGLFVLGCWVLALRVLSAIPAKLTVPGIAAVVLGGAGLCLLAAEPLLDRSDWAVVVRGEVGRTGPHAEIYPPALDQPVPAGAEVLLLEARDGWVLCALGGERAWLPSASVQRVRPARAGQTPGGV